MLVRPGRIGQVGATRRLAAVVPPVALKPLIAVTNQRFPDAMGTTPGTLASGAAMKLRSFHQFGFDCTEIFLLIPTVGRQTSTPYAEQVLAAALSFVKLAVQVGSTTVPISVAGSRSFELVHDGIDPWLKIGPIPASAFSLAKFTRDDQIFIRAQAKNNNAGSLVIPNGEPFSRFGSLYATYAAGTEPVDDVDGTGAISTTGGSTNNLGFPIFVIATPLQAGAKSVVDVDDSIGVGFTESWATSPQYQAGYGYFSRSLITSAGTGAIAGINMTRATSTSQQWLDSHTWQDRYLDLVNMGLFKHGTNDFTSSGTAITAAAMQARATAMAAAMRARGVQKVFAVTPPPRTDSGTATQPVAGWSSGGPPDQYIQWLRGGAGGLIDGLVDMRQIVGEPGNEFIFNATDGATDRLHLSVAGHIAVAGVLRTLLLSQAVT